MKKKNVSPTTARSMRKGKALKEREKCMDAGWTEMAGGLTRGKILDLFKNFYLLPSSLNVFFSGILGVITI
jgi:hypothetical protein